MYNRAYSVATPLFVPAITACGSITGRAIRAQLKEHTVEVYPK